MKKTTKWPRPKKRSDFLIVPLAKGYENTPTDPAFGDFNGPLLEQDDEKENEVQYPPTDKNN